MSPAGAPWLRYQQQPTTPTPEAAPAAPTAGAPWERYQQQATTPPPAEPQPQSFQDFLRYGSNREVDDPTGITQAVKDFAAGTAAGFSEVPATIGGVLHRIGGNLIGDSDRVTDAFRRATTDAPDTTAASAGKLFEGVAEWIAGEGVLKGLTQGARMKRLAPIVSMLEQHPRIMEAALTHPEVVRYLPDALRGAVLGTAQTAAHGGTLAESLQSGAIAGATGYIVPNIAREIGGRLGMIAEEVQPTIRDMGGNVKFRVLASEARGPNGEIIATPRAQNATDIANESGVRAERQGAFKELHTSLAKTGVEEGLKQSNEAISQSGVSPNIRPTSMGGDWRYIPPDGSTSLTGDEARTAMNEIRDQWLSRDWTPEQDSRFQQAYDDIRNQVERGDRFTASQGLTLHDPAGAARGVESYRDAADLFDRTSQAKFQHIGDLRTRYNELIAARDDAQNNYFRAWNRGEDSAKALDAVNASDRELENFVNSDAVQGKLAPGIAQRAAEEQRLSSAFRRLQNVTDRTFNLQADTAQQINQPRLATRLGSLANDVESIKSQYGDVLNPVLGDQGLDHIIEMGELLKNSERQDAGRGILESMVKWIKRSHMGGRGAIAAGGAAYAAHVIGGILGIKTLGLGIGTEMAYRMALRKLATDPAIAERFIMAMRNGTPARIAGPLLASMVTHGTMSRQREEAANAPSE